MAIGTQWKFRIDVFLYESDFRYDTKAIHLSRLLYLEMIGRFYYIQVLAIEHRFIEANMMIVIERLRLRRPCTFHKSDSQFWLPEKRSFDCVCVCWWVCWWVYAHNR